MWVYNGFGEHPATVARPHISSPWEMAVSNTLLIGQTDHPPRAGKRVDPVHI